MIHHRSTISKKQIDLELSEQVKAIANYIYKNKDHLKHPGLLTGKAGVTLLFAYLSIILQSKKYLNITYEYLNELKNALEHDMLGYDMGSGIAGIGFVFQHLRNIGILKSSEKTNLFELDEFLSNALLFDLRAGNWDPLYGIVGIGIYFLERNKETKEKKYLKKIIDYLIKTSNRLKDHQVWITRGFKINSIPNYNFGMAHGMPGLLAFLAHVYQRDICRQKIRKMINGSVPFLLQNEVIGNSVYRFPGSIDIGFEGMTTERKSRLGWCYGDLSIANALIHCGKAMGESTLISRGVDIALKTTKRTLKNSGCIDAPFCHGAAGLIHQYHRLYRFTKKEVFQKATEKWINISLQQYYTPGEGAGGYYYQSFNEDKNVFEPVPEVGLLEGSAGIAMVYSAYFSGIEPDWDIIFLTDV